MMLDLSLMRSVHVDPDKRTARVEPGAILGDVDLIHRKVAAWILSMEARDGTGQDLTPPCPEK